MSQIVDLGAFLSPSPPPHHLILLNQPLHSLSNFSLLFQTSSLKICADGAVNRLHSFDPNLIPDIIIGDLDSADPTLLDKYQSQGTRIERDDCQDTTDLEKCIKTSISFTSNDTSIVVMGVTGGRLDHMLANLNAALKGPRSIVLIGEGNISCILDPNIEYALHSSTFLTPMCGIIPLGSSVKCTSEGLKWDMNDRELSWSGMLSTCNQFVDKVVNVRITGGPCLWTCEPK